jgi:omega-6 fatty acid desaturase (delta-12 desaturase)
MDDAIPVSQVNLQGTVMTSPHAPFERLTASQPPPPPAHLTHLRPGNLPGGLFTVSCSALTGVSLYLSAVGTPVAWLTGQVLLAVALLQWFVILHECGHETLFRTRRLHAYIGHLASVFCGIPFRCWTRVHAMHHKWIGWQDIDPTTARLAPRPLGRGERAIVNACWKFWIPLFSVVYRATFWNLRALRRIVPNRHQRRQLTCNIALLLIVYAGTLSVSGVGRVVQTAGLGVVLSLVLQDLLLLSQHTHIPLNVSHGKRVQPYPAIEQDVFTRSLRFPPWFSTAVLLNIDAHELHHMYPHIPGYRLRHINYSPKNEAHWWQWIRAAKSVPGDVFLFENRNESGFHL